MTTQTSSDLQKLNDTVTRLAETLAASERRYASLAKIIRWGGMALLVLVLAAAYFSSAIMANAFVEDWPEKRLEQFQKAIANDPPALDGLIEQLGGTEEIDGMIVKLLQNVSSIANREAATQECRDIRVGQGLLPVCFSNAAARDLGTYFKNENGEIPTPPAPPSKDDPKYKKRGGSFDADEYEKDMKAYGQNMKAYGKRLMQGTLMAGAQSMVDAAVLVHRLRRDSDFLRTRMFEQGSTERVLDSIGFELNVMNRALRLVPAMAAEMSAMNRNMSVMSYSMGSTAGRMGSMLPW
ncbi:MAG: hypothetical protein QNK18_05220 [Gammaproteobacteria bacterium]|nr:hypothetical protein [Gammaproteobacteria bacterium]